MLTLTLRLSAVFCFGLSAMEKFLSERKKLIKQNISHAFSVQKYSHQVSEKEEKVQVGVFCLCVKFVGRLCRKFLKV